MASESVTESTETRPAARCNIQMVDAINERTAKARAIVDLMVTVDTQQLSPNTIPNAGWAVQELLDQLDALVAQSEDVVA